MRVQEDEMDTWFDFACKEGDLLLEIARVRTMATPIPSERESQKRQLRELELELDALRQEMARYETSTNNPAKSIIAASPMPWIAKAREIARALLASAPKLRTRPITDIASKVHKEMITQGITGRGGRTPSVDSIKRHALSGIKK